MKAFSLLGKDSINRYQDFRYLSTLFCDAMLEAELYRTGTSDGFEAVTEVRDFLDEFSNTPYWFPRMPHTIAETLRFKSEKSLGHLSELRLEVALLSAELKDFPNNTRMSIEEMRDLFLNASKVFQRESYDYLPRRLVA